jgi:hypothetical protein
MKVGGRGGGVIKIPAVYQGGPRVPLGRFIFSDLAWHLNFPMMRKNNSRGPTAAAVRATDGVSRSQNEEETASPF